MAIPIGTQTENRIGSQEVAGNKMSGGAAEVRSPGDNRTTLLGHCYGDT